MRGIRDGSRHGTPPFPFPDHVTAQREESHERSVKYFGGFFLPVLVLVLVAARTSRIVHTSSQQ